MKYTFLLRWHLISMFMAKFLCVKNIAKSLFLIIVFFSFFCLLEFLGTRYIYFRFIEIFLLCAVVINIMSFLFISQKQYYKNFLLLFLFFISIIYIKIFNHLNINNDSIKFTFAFYTGITNFLLFLSCFLNKKYKILNFIITVVSLLPTIFIWQYFFISGSFISVDAILAICQTDLSEAKSYMYDTMGIKQYIGLFLLLVISFVIFQCNNKLKINNIKSGKIITLLVISILLNIFLVYRYKENIITQIITDTNQYLKNYKIFKKLASERKIDNIKLDETQNINKGIYVLVLGESQNKKHMSAYGYNKKTTPWLDSMEHNKNFIKFENAFSCHTHTVPVLSYALTSKNQYNNVELSKTLSILDIAKAIDMKTVWLSNQVHYGGLDTPVSVIADTAQQQKWINENFSKSMDTDFYDINLLEELNKIKFYDDMLIVIHLMGNHVSYKDRYPRDFSIFKDGKTAYYDNSILYNDYVIKNIFETINSLPNFKALIYCADHSEAVDQDLSHNADQFVSDMLYIPIYVYLSDSYIKDNLQIYMNLYNHRNYYFTNDLLFNLVLGILNIRVPDIYEQYNDITNEGYDNNINRFKTLHGYKNIVDI